MKPAFTRFTPFRSQPRFAWQAILFGSTLLLSTLAGVHAANSPKHSEFRSKLQTTLNQHLSQLLKDDGSVVTLKGKTAKGEEALTFYLMFEASGNETFRLAALDLADQVLKDMRAMKFGVLPIKEKEKPGGQIIMGGGPPALGAYASALAYILHQEGGRSNDLKYLATVIDQFPWNENGWWASTIDVRTGESKLPMTQPTIINKNAGMAKAAGILSFYLRDIDPKLAASLKQKTDQCIYRQILPVQEADGFWHYNLTGNDPENKDVLGYFMLTTKELMDLQHFNPAYREARLNASLKKAQAFVANQIAPMAAPNKPSIRSHRATRDTPKRYSLKEDAKRSYQLGLILIGSEYAEEGIKIMNAALEHFPTGNVGQDGSHAAEPSALILSEL